MHFIGKEFPFPIFWGNFFWREFFAVRETGVSRHQGGPTEGLPETPRTSQHYRIEGIKGVPDFVTKGNGNDSFLSSVFPVSVLDKFLLEVSATKWIRVFFCWCFYGPTLRAQIE